MLAPLGYRVGMTKNVTAWIMESQRGASKARKNRWAFIGALKNDRRKSIDVFQSLRPHVEAGPQLSKRISTSEMGDIYRDSDVVWPGRNDGTLLRIRKRILP